MQTIQMYDQLEMEKKSSKGIALMTNLSYIPVNENNLVYKAAKLLMEQYQIQEGVSIHLNKFIPVAAGMAGGSSDAAAALVGMNKLFRLGMSKKELMKVGVKIGADVPYCIMRGTALSEGIGEKLTAPSFPAGMLYFDRKAGSERIHKICHTNLKLDEKTKHPDIDGMLDALQRQDLYGITDRMENVLESVTVPAYPVIQEIKIQYEGTWGAECPNERQRSDSIWNF